MIQPIRPGQPYRPSGRSGLAAVPLALVLGVAVAAVMATAYAYATLYIPFVGYVTVILTVLFGGAVGAAVMMGLRWGKARSPMLGGLLGLLAGLAALYLSWATWIFALLRRAEADPTLQAVFLDPRALWEAILRVNEVGAWSVRGMTPTGALLWFFWAVEALIIVLIPATLGGGQGAAPFCEGCDAWCEETQGAFVGADAPEAELKAHLQRAEISYLQRLGPAEPGAARRIRYDLSSCPCGATNTLSATQIVSSGADKEESTSLVGPLLVSREAARAVRGLGGAAAPRVDVAVAGGSLGAP